MWGIGLKGFRNHGPKVLGSLQYCCGAQYRHQYIGNPVYRAYPEASSTIEIPQPLISLRMNKPPM